MLEPTNFNLCRVFIQLNVAGAEECGKCITLVFKSSVFYAIDEMPSENWLNQMILCMLQTFNVLPLTRKLYPKSILIKTDISFR